MKLFKSLFIDLDYLLILKILFYDNQLQQNLSLDFFVLKSNNSSLVAF